jgi:SRSO17 transposase
MDQVAQETNQRIGDPLKACLLIDESGFAKQGRKSAGVARQWLGRLGKVDNGQVGVYGVLCNGRMSAPIDCRLYLPKEWTDDRKRCLQAGVPKEEIEFRTKDQLALEIIQHARQAGIKYGWVGADAGYGKSPEVFYRLEEIQQTYFIDIPSDFGVYLEDPQPHAPKTPQRGRRAKGFQTEKKSQQARLLEGLKKQNLWKELKARDTTRGKLKVRAWRQSVHVWDGHSAQALQVTLLISENLDGTERKYTVTNAPENWTLGKMVYAQRQRYWVERSFEDAKGQCGMADYQVQKWTAWQHHMSLVMMAMLFMLEERLRQKEEHPLLSCKDIEVLLAHFLPRRDVNKAEVIKQVQVRHRLRKQAIESHSRAQKRCQRINSLK